MSEVTETTEVQKWSSAIAKIKENLPTMQQGQKIALDLVKEIKEAKITTKAQRDDMVGKLETVKKIFDKVNKLRREITDPLDAAKEYLMQFEREFNYSAKTENRLSLFWQPLCKNCHE